MLLRRTQGGERTGQEQARVGGSVQVGGVESQRDEEEVEEKTVEHRDGGRLSTGTRLRHEERWAVRRREEGSREGREQCRVEEEGGKGEEEGGLEFDSFSISSSCRANRDSNDEVGTGS